MRESNERMPDTSSQVISGENWGADNSKTSAAGQSHCILFSGGGRAEIRAWRLNISRCKVNSSSASVMKNQVLTVDSDASCELKEPDCDKSHISMCDKAQCYSVKKMLSGDVKEGSCSNQLEENIASATSAHSHSLSDSSSKDTPHPVQCKFEHLATHFLGESRHKQLNSTWKTHKLRLDPETRIMSLAASPLVELWGGQTCSKTEQEGFGKGRRLHLPHAKLLSCLHILSSAGSDGALRIFLFDELTRKFSTLQETTYHKGCVLKVLHYTHYIHANPAGQLTFVLSASTNGNILIWSLGELVMKEVSRILHKSGNSVISCREREPSNLEDSHNCGAHHDICGTAEEDQENEDDYIDFTKQREETGSKDVIDWEPVCSLKAHQSGVNSLHALQLSDSRFLVASGGDDNAVTIQLLEVSDAGVRVVVRVVKEMAHAAQVTGIWLVSPTFVVSTSIDQRINVWNIKQSTEKQMELQMVACKYINVSDVSSMDVCLYKNSVYLCIGGEGLCLHSFKADREEQSWMLT